MKRFRNKLALIVAMLATLLFFSNDFGLIDIEKTAIIVALAVDYDKEAEMYDVTAQIAIPEATDQSATNGNSLIDGKGRTIAEAIDEIGLRSGWYPKLSFCNLVVLGETLVNGTPMNAVDYFVRTDKMQDAALLVACEGQAKDCLSASTPLDSISSFALQKIITKDIARAERIAITNIKTFVKNYYSLSECSFMPLIRKIKAKKTGGNNQGSALTAADESPSEGGKEEDYVFDATSTIVFHRGIKKCVLNEKETLFFNMAQKKSLDTYFPLENVVVGGKHTNVLLHLNDSFNRFSFDVTGKPAFTIRMKLSCRFEDVNATQPISDLSPVQEIPEDVLLKLKSGSEEILKELFRKTKEADCDLFRLKERLYKFHHSRYRDYEDDVLRYTDFKTEIEVIGEKRISSH